MQELNLQPSPCKGAALPVELTGYGAYGWNRTTGAQGFNLPLYHLSYVSMVPKEGLEPSPPSS